MQKTNLIKFFWSVVGFFVLLVLGVIFLKIINKTKPSLVVCTQEARICPDGSAVVRLGSKCEFAPCPEKKLDKNDLIQLESPAYNAVIASPLKITGQARGNWFFEGSFPIVLVDGDGKFIAQAVAKADGEWMTTNFVPFVATLEFSKTENHTNNRGTLILRKDNPSGLSQNDDSLEIPVFFK